MDPFGSFLGWLLVRRGLTQLEFGRRVDLSGSTINLVIHGRRKPAWRRAELWADVLALEGAERERFLDEYALACSPERCRALVDRLRANLQAQHGAVAEPPIPYDAGEGDLASLRLANERLLRLLA